jgi:hypothetical protein
VKFRGDLLPTNSRSIQPLIVKSFFRLNIEQPSMRTIGLKSLTSTLASKNVKCVGSSQWLRLNDFSLSTVRFRNCVALAETI